MGEVLYQKYRPQSFGDVVGQKEVVDSLVRTLKKGSSRSFIFHGPSGVGKTTLARISAHAVGCHDKDILEIDAATHTGVDDMRQVQEVLRYRPFGDSEHRAIIIDEAHAISKQAWNSLLKSVEEPPEFITWFFCTTEVGKIPATIKTRCTSFTLKECSDAALHALFTRVCLGEKLMKFPEDIRDVIIKEALGSPRQMLVNLTMCREAKTKKEAAAILQTAHESDATIELCRFLAAPKPGSWPKAMSIISQIDAAPESVRIVVSNYMAACMKGAKSDRDACHFLQILEAFSESYNASDKMAPLFLSIGRVLFAGK
jgi:DNA polymerase III gamma/tau subunit